MSEENKQRLKEHQKKIIVKQKNKHKKVFIFFPLHGIKMEQKALHFGKECIIKNLFHEHKQPINIDNVDIKKIGLSSKKSNSNTSAF